MVCTDVLFHTESSQSKIYENAVKEKVLKAISTYEKKGSVG
jgi:hypothetical protein